MEINDMLGHPNVSDVLGLDTGMSDERRSNCELKRCGSDGQVSLPSAVKHNFPPHERLPTEIIGMIFRRCLDGEPLYLPICYACSTVTMPWALGQVCSRWRDILINEPIFWSSFTLSYETTQDKEFFTQRVKEIIFPRSKLDLISLTCFDSRYNHNIDNADAGGVVATLIMPNLARFRHLSLSVSRVALEPFITSPPGLAVSLVSLELEFTWASSHNDLEYSDFHPASITAFEEAPNLRKVCLKGRYFCEFKGINPLTLPWGQLTELDISMNLPYPAVVNFLPHCTQLIECSLSVGCNDEVIIPSSKITLPRLRSITLYSGYTNSRACPSLLQILILPVLKRFTFHLPDETPVQATLLELIIRSGCLVEFFKMSSFFDDVLDDVAVLLEAMPSLRKLVVPYGYPLSVPAIKRMIAGELVPHLEVMHCGVESLPMTLELLETRRSGNSPGALESYRGIQCALTWGRGMSECTCPK